MENPHVSPLERELMSHMKEGNEDLHKQSGVNYDPLVCFTA
jgi:hypothetical protein